MSEAPIRDLPIRDLPIRDLFVSDVTRDIPPVVYFHEQDPARLQAEVSEYIITGGWPPEHPNHQRVPDGIHEQYVRLLTGIAAELDKPGGPELPTAWISGFYGSGKSSFAKLLGLALDGVALPDGRSMADAWLARDTSPRAQELRDAWKALRAKVDPLAVVFDVGGVARDNEQIHNAALRQVQARLGYCTSDPHVADFELGLERNGEWERFEAKAAEVLGQPWAAIKDQDLAEEPFSEVMHALHPERYTDPMAWFISRAGTHHRVESPEEAVKAIGDMLRFRRPAATLFLVVDEVSQYILSSKDRVDRLRAFATALGARLKGKVWLLALGQQQLDNQADDSFLVWAKDRFPPRLRVHLATTNIRDVIHKRLLQKTPEAEAHLRGLFETHRPDLKLFAYGCEAVTPDEFVDVYPMLPGQIDLLLRITTALRTRSSRAQGDDQAIRGLLQLLGELFREQQLADLPVGSLVTLDRIYEVQNTALDADVQDSMARVLARCADDLPHDAGGGLMLRAAKAVALLELIQETDPTDAELVARCLYDRVDRGNHLAAVTEALEELRRRNLLGYSEKTGYKLQSSAAEEWEKERREISVPREDIVALVQGGLKLLVERPDRPRLQGRPFPWAAVFSDGRQAHDVTLVDPRDEAAVRVDFRLLIDKDRIASTWIKRSAEAALRDRLVWVAGGAEHVEGLCRELQRSKRMVARYKPRRESLSPARKLLLTQEENREEDLGGRVRDALAAAWMAGSLYFRGRAIEPRQQGATFAPALHHAATTILGDLFPHFVVTQVQPSELTQLLAHEITGPSSKFLSADLGILQLDSGRYVADCSGVVPRRVLETIEETEGLGGTSLLAHFGGPPYGYTASVVKACVVGLLRAGKITAQPEGGAVITAVRDADTRELFDKDRTFKRASFYPAGEDDIGRPARVRICKFLEKHLTDGKVVERADHDIADVVAGRFPGQATRLRDVLTRLDRLPGPPKTPTELTALDGVLERCVASARQTKPTVQLVRRHLDALRDGMSCLRTYDAELTPTAIDAVRAAHQVLTIHLAQLTEVEVEATNLDLAGQRLSEQLGRPTPWRQIAALDDDIEQVRAAYAVERQRLLGWQEEQATAARSRVKLRDGFSTLTSDQSHQVLRPLTEAQTDTSAEAIAPSLAELKGPFLLRLQQAEERAHDTLDKILSAGPKPMIVRVKLASDLRNREVASEADVEALTKDIRERLLPLVRDGKRIRLV